MESRIRGRGHRKVISFLFSILLILIDVFFFLNNRNFDFKELEVVNKYYPQYYHKTDKACCVFLRSLSFFLSLNQKNIVVFLYI